MGDEALTRLARRAQEELALLAYPSKAWVQPRLGPDGTQAVDVLVVGAAQCGTAVAFALRRAGITNVAVIDAAAPGREGPWRTIARMNELRTPKHQVGVETGIAALTAPAWYRARHGAPAWARLERIGREDWADYLDWLRAQAGIEVDNGVRLDALRPVPGRDDLLAAELRAVEGSGDAVRTVHARHVVLTTGFVGGGLWHTPEHIVAAVPPALRHHACEGYDPAAYRGLRVGILGHGASAFDAAATLLEAGAAHVDLCFRRSALPLVNPHRAVENHGFLAHLADLDDAVRWDVARHFDGADQPPAPDGYRRAVRHANLAIHPASPWERLTVTEDGVVEVSTPTAAFRWDRIICATGARIDLRARPELTDLEPWIARWGDRYQPPPGAEHPGLAEAPYLGPGFELQGRPGALAALGRIHACNAASYVSHGPHTTSISGVKYAAPRVVDAIARALLRDQQDTVLRSVQAFDERDAAIVPSAVQVA